MSRHKLYIFFPLPQTQSKDGNVHACSLRVHLRGSPISFIIYISATCILSPIGHMHLVFYFHFGFYIRPQTSIKLNVQTTTVRSPPRNLRPRKRIEKKDKKEKEKRNHYFIQLNETHSSVCVDSQQALGHALVTSINLGIVILSFNLVHMGSFDEILR